MIVNLNLFCISVLFLHLYSPNPSKFCHIKRIPKLKHVVFFVNYTLKCCGCGIECEKSKLPCVHYCNIFFIKMNYSFETA